MKKRLVWILALPVALAAYAALPADSAPPLLPAAVAAAPTPAGETARIQAHLEAVERELLARDVSHLSAAQRAARARHVRVLREYRERGVFPHNHDFPGERVPYFVDGHGTLCAMAYLIARSGHEALVQRVKATRNNAYVPELAGDAELVAWLRDAGLSLEEAARIQPSYGGGGCCNVRPERVSTGNAVASAFASTLGGVSIGMTLSGKKSRWGGLLGVGAGAAGIALGLDAVGDGGASGALGAATAGIGALSTAVGTWTLLRLPGDRPEGDTPAAPAATGTSLSMAPLLPADGQSGPGVVLRVRF